MSNMNGNDIIMPMHFDEDDLLVILSKPSDDEKVSGGKVLTYWGCEITLNTPYGWDSISIYHPANLKFEVSYHCFIDNFLGK